MSFFWGVVALCTGLDFAVWMCLILRVHVWASLFNLLSSCVFGGFSPLTASSIHKYLCFSSCRCSYWRCSSRVVIFKAMLAAIYKSFSLTGNRIEIVLRATLKNLCRTPLFFAWANQLIWFSIFAVGMCLSTGFCSSEAICVACCPFIDLLRSCFLNINLFQNAG